MVTTIVILTYILVTYLSNYGNYHSNLNLHFALPSQKPHNLTDQEVRQVFGEFLGNWTVLRIKWTNHPLILNSDTKSNNTK